MSRKNSMELWEEEWVSKAACRGMPLETFYPAVGTSPKEALETCGRCPVREECLEFALTTNHQHSYDGIWGGKLVSERRAILRGRKHDARRKRKEEGKDSGLQMG